MKPLLKYVVISFTLMIWACSSSMEADALKMAELQCEAIQLTMGGAMDALNGKMDMDKIQAHQKKVQKFQLRMTKKYDTPEEKMEFHSKVMEASLKICMQ